MKNILENEKIRKYMNRKILLGVSALLMCVALIAICSFVPFIIDPKRWQTTEFLTDELIISAIVIFSIVATMFIGQASNAQNANSNLAKARVRFFESLPRITNVNAFSQWVKKVMQPRDIRTMRERVMRSAGIEDYSVIDLEYAEIKALLETPQKYGERYYKGLSQKQIDTVLGLKSGKHRINLVEPEYYLSVKNLIDPRTITERSSKEGLKKSLYLVRSIVAKLVLSIVTAMIFASLMRDMSSGAGVAEAFQKFISRLWSMISSAFMGYIVGCQINDIDAEYIEMRTLTQNMFLQDTEFKPLNQQEDAKNEFIERVKSEQVLRLETAKEE